MRIALLHQTIHWLQVVTEMVLGFDRSFATPELLARQEALFTALHGGLAALPINLPGTGDLHHHARHLLRHCLTLVATLPHCCCGTATVLLLCD